MINLHPHGANFKSRFFTLSSRLYGSRWIVKRNKRQKRAEKCVIFEKYEFKNCMLYAKSRKRKEKRKAYNTKCSQAVTHPSTNSAQRCLTSVIGRELVHSTWYGRWRERGWLLSNFNTYLDVLYSLAFATKSMAEAKCGQKLPKHACMAYSIRILDRKKCRKNEKRRCQQHQVFPGGHPSKY